MEGSNICEVSACMPTPCQNRGTCSLNLRSLGGYECSCADGYTGTNCELDVLECAEGECAIYKILLSIRGYSVMIRVCMQTSVQIRVRIMASVLNWRAVSSVTVRVDLVAIAVSTWTPVPHPTPVQLVSTLQCLATPHIYTGTHHTPPHTDCTHHTPTTYHLLTQILSCVWTTL